eukprot:NODE_2857_length_864_cov_659.337454.p2 GENE.NODE_2857_length_864_cov_659.337454~~NODE_2857_length_864_cov_659.337454.p2  ORF type:complete len:200 (+),score=58.15 NODE_2857_length_864_cov_659.337454:93-692(+)
MALFAATRGVLRSATRTALRPAVRTAPSVTAFARTYVTVETHSRAAVVDRLNNFHDVVLSANWADYLDIVYNEPFWEAELERIDSYVQPYLHETEVSAKYEYVQEMMDVFYQCTDVRDHLNELAELVTRSSGLMGTGYNAGEKVENMDEHAQLCSEAYDRLVEKHPEFLPKIEQTVGHGLAVLRMKHKFRFSSAHRYFF